MVIARSRAIDTLRRRTPEPTDMDFENQIADLQAEQAGDDAVDRVAGGPYAEMAPRQRTLAASDAFYSDMSQSQIAEETGIPLGTIKMRMAAGLRRLRDYVEEDGDA